MLFASLLFLALPLFAEDSAWQTDCFSGLNDSVSPAIIADCEAQSALNIETNLGGNAIKRRPGYSVSANLTIASSPVSGTHHYRDSGGNNVDIACHDRMCSRSVNGNAYATFLTTAGGTGALPVRWSFADINGNLYLANDRRDKIGKWDGTTFTSPAGFPLGSILALTQDRMAIGDITGNINRVYYSSSGAVENWTTGSNNDDPYYDDLGSPGERITGLIHHRGVFYVFKSRSITGCNLGTQFTTTCSILSSNIGTNDPTSIVAAGSDLYFKGNDGHFWKMSGGGSGYNLGPGQLDQISRKIYTLLSSQSSGAQRDNVQTTKSNWEAGVETPTGTWDTASINGSILPSSWTAVVNNSSTSYYTGTFDGTTVYVGLTYLALAPSTTQLFTYDTFSGSVIGSSWTATNGPTSTVWSESAVTGYACRVGDNGTGASVTYPLISKAQTSPPAGKWGADFYIYPAYYHSGVDTIIMEYPYDPATGNGYSLKLYEMSTLNLYRIDNNVYTLIKSASVSPSLGVNAVYVVRTSTGFMEVYLGIGTPTLKMSVTDTAHWPTAPVMRIGLGEGTDGCGAPLGPAISQAYVSGYHGFGTYFSKVFDTTYSTPIGSGFYVSSSVPANTTLVHQTRSSSNGSTGWTAWASVVPGTRPELSFRYIQYLSTFSTTIATITPTMTITTMTVVTTGYFVTQCIEPDSAISQWSTLSCSETLAGNGSVVYYATSAATCATLPTTDPSDTTKWINAVMTNNADLGIATNTAVKIGFRSLLGSATDQAQIDSCTLSWKSGTPAQPVWGLYASVQNAVYWTTTIGSSITYANRILKYDLNVQGWFPFDLKAQAPFMSGLTMFYGDSSAGKVNKYGGVDSDAGGGIQAHWTTRDIGATQPFQEKDFKKVSLLSRNAGSGTADATWLLSDGKTGTWTVTLSTGSGLNYTRSNYNLPFSSPQNFMNLKLGNDNANEPFEFLGIRVDYFTRPWRVSGP